jgi:hypothetical protein
VKIYLSLCLALGFCALAALCARADDEDDKPLAPAHDPDVNSPTYDGSTFNPAPAKQVSAEEIQAAREAAEEEDTWLIRSSEQRQKMKSTGTGQADPLDPYQRIASDKDLAKLAGLTATASPNPADITNLRADSDPLKDGATLRVDPSQLTSSPQKLPIMAGTGFKPLITPLSATDVAGLHDFYASAQFGPASGGRTSHHRHAGARFRKPHQAGQAELRTHLRGAARRFPGQVGESGRPLQR